MNPGAIVVFKVLGKVAWKLVRHWAHKDARVRGRWVGSLSKEDPVDPEAAKGAGYRYDTPCRLVLNQGRSPLYWAHESGTDYMFDTPLISDGGSTPELARGLVKSWADLEPFGTFRREFYFHDSAYKNAGCWVRLPRKEALENGVPIEDGAKKSDWVWMRLTRGMADTLLFQQMPSSGGRNAEVRAIFHAVRVGGGKSWRRHRRRAG